MTNRQKTVQVPSKEVMFDDFFRSAAETFEALQVEFGFDGLADHFFGNKFEESVFLDKKHEQVAKKHVKASHAWEKVSNLYDFAVDGLANEKETWSIVLDASEVLTLASYDQCPLLPAWNRLIWQADGRHGLESGDSIMIEKLAFLADVDVRTVRNAISAGHLVCSEDSSVVDNESARKWLMGRRGFKPTVFAGQTQTDLAGVATPSAFATFLKEQRQRIQESGGSLSSQHPAVTGEAVGQVESGVFVLPLSAVNPLADYYQLERKQFLSCVMRTFFSEQLQAMQEIFQTQQ